VAAPAPTQGVLLRPARGDRALERRARRWHCLPGTRLLHPRVESAHRGGRLLAVDLFRGADLGPWQQRTFRSPHMPMGLTHADLARFGGLANVAGWDYELLAQRIQEDWRATGPALAASFVKAADRSRHQTFAACSGTSVATAARSPVCARAKGASSGRARAGAW
jgi:hypothetical protein